jgi:hypothetical protein
MKESANAAKTQLDSGRCMRNMCMWGEQGGKSIPWHGGYTRDDIQSFSGHGCHQSPIISS